jgi:hypothetical protein
MDNNTFYINLSEDKIYQNEFVWEDGKPLKYLGPINDVNIFVGANNSRKSRIMRMLMVNKELKINQTDLIFNLEILYETLEEFESMLPNTTVQESIRLNLSNANNHIISEILPKTYNIIQKNQIHQPFNRDIYIAGDKFKNTKEQVYKYLNFKNSREHNGLTKENFLTTINNFRDELIILNEIMSLTQIDEPLEIINSEDYIELKSKLSHYQTITVLFIQRFSKIKKYEKKIENIITYLSELDYYESKQILIKDCNYIPILRSAVSFFYIEDNRLKKHLNDFYETTTNKLYNLKDTNKVKIFTGRALYEQIKIARNSIRSDREKFEEFEEFLSKTFFNNNKIDIIAEHKPNNQDEEHISIHFDNEPNKQRSLHDLGDGIQSLIILLFPLFMAENEEWFFIEEPEMNLHPAMQRIFLDTITGNETIVNKKLKIFFTTHSNHLLDLSIENSDKISIFSFEKSLQKESKSIVRNISSGDLEVLNQLGVNNSSVFMANCSIWVEGHTDRKYIKGFMQLYKQHFDKLKDDKKGNEEFNYKEDIHYSFFQYGGSTIVHYNFDKENIDSLIKAKALSNRILLISDEDEIDKKQERHTQLKNQLGKNFITTKEFNGQKKGGREIENLLSYSILIKIIERTLDNSNKYKIPAEPLKHSVYINEKFGQYIKTEFNITYSITDKYGTLTSSYKKDFAEAFLDLVSEEKITWNELEKVTQDFCMVIINHIKDNNKN